MIDPTLHASGHEYNSRVMYLLCYLLCYIHSLLIGVACLHTVIHEPCPTFTCKTPTFLFLTTEQRREVLILTTYILPVETYQQYKVFIRLMDKHSNHRIFDKYIQIRLKYTNRFRLFTINTPASVDELFCSSSAYDSR